MLITVIAVLFQNDILYGPLTEDVILLVSVYTCRMKPCVNSFKQTCVRACTCKLYVCVPVSPPKHKQRRIGCSNSSNRRYFLWLQQ